jgi:hypothetical protein
MDELLQHILYYLCAAYIQKLKLVGGDGYYQYMALCRKNLASYCMYTHLHVHVHKHAYGTIHVQRCILLSLEVVSRPT